MKPFAVGAVAAFFLIASGVSAETRTVGPEDDWRGVINRAEPGDEIVLLPGRYTEPLTVRVSGTADAPVIIRGSSMEEGSRSTLGYTGTTSNVVDIADGTAFVVLRGLHCDAQKPMKVQYDGIEMDAGFRLDILVEGKIIVELKSVEALLPVHHAQLLTFLKLTGCQLGLLINFNVPVIKDGIRRIALSKSREET